MTFGNTLHKLLEYSGVKRTQLSEYLGYDISYIGRWINDVKRPSLKNNENLIAQIAACIDKLSDENGKASIADAYGLDRSKLNGSYEQFLTDLLTESYHACIDPQGSGKLEENNIRFSKQGPSYEDNLQRMVRAISRQSYSAEDTLEMIGLAESYLFENNLCQEYWNTVSQNLPAGKKVLFHLIFNPELLPKDGICRDICVFCSGVSENIQAEFYCATDNIALFYGITVCKNAMVGFSYYDSLLQQDVGLFSVDVKIVSEYYEAARGYLRKAKKLVFKNSLPDLCKENFFQNFMITRSIRTLNTVIPAFICPAVLEHFACSPQAKDIYRFFSQIVTSWTLVVYQSAIYSFFFDGKLSLDGKNIYLTLEERHKALSELLSSLSERKQVVILKDNNPLLKRDEVDCSLNMTAQRLFLFRNNADDAYCQIYHSDDSALVTAFNMFLDDIISLPEQYVLSGKAAEEFLRTGLSLPPMDKG